jgi:hypothetical protein
MKAMSDVKDQEVNQQQLSLIDFCERLPSHQPTTTTQTTIIQFPARRVSKSRKKALERVIDHANKLNW